jgi:hypothetical protein
MLKTRISRYTFQGLNETKTRRFQATLSVSFSLSLSLSLSLLSHGSQLVYSCTAPHLGFDISALQLRGEPGDAALGLFNLVRERRRRQGAYNVLTWFRV